VTAPTSESYRENRRWRRRGKRKTMRIAAAAAAHTFSCLCFPFLQMKNGEIMDEPKIIKNDSLISSFSSSAGQNEKHMEKNSDGVGGRRAEIVSRYFVLGFFLSRCWQKALRIADIFYYSREKLFVQQMTRPSSLCRLLFLILIAIFYFSIFLVVTSFRILCVCVCVDFELVCSWLRLNKLPPPPKAARGIYKFL
jgi:hypothetical protein